MSVKFKGLKKIVETKLMDRNRGGQSIEDMWKQKLGEQVVSGDLKPALRWLPYSFFDVADINVSWFFAGCKPDFCCFMSGKQSSGVMKPSAVLCFKKLKA